MSGLFRLRRGPWTTDPDPVVEAERVIDAERAWATTETPTVRVVHEPDAELLADVFADGVAYQTGQFSSLSMAMDEAADYLRTDPVHGARRAMLVLAGHLDVDMSGAVAA